LALPLKRETSNGCNKGTKTVYASNSIKKRTS